MAKKITAPKKLKPVIQATAPDPALPSAYTAEATDPDAVAQSFDIEDEWYGQISTGDPFYEVAKPYIEKNKDKHFRFLSDPHCLKRTTRGYQPVYDARGQAVICNGQRLAWIPRHEHERRMAANAEKATSALTDSRDGYAETERRAAKDSAGSIEILPDEGQRFRGSRAAAF